MNFLVPVRVAARRYRDRPALEDRGETWTYGRLWALISRSAERFERWGLVPGDWVMVWLPNGASFLAAHFGLLARGIVSVPVKEESGPGEVERFLSDSRPRLLIAPRSLLDTLPASALEGLRVETDEAVPVEGPEADLPPVPLRGDHPASINYSYYFGEGRPYGAVLTHRNYAWAAGGYAKFHSMHAGDRTLLVLPMPHVFSLGGAILSSLYRGACLVVGDSLRPRKILDRITKGRITQLPCIPQLFEVLARFHDPARHDLASIRHLVSGGDYLPADAHARLEEALGVTIVQGYGLTECFPIVCNPPDARNRPGTLGVEGHRTVRFRITGPEGRPLPRGEVGEIEIAGPSVMAGYLDAPEATERVLRDGWLRTGDLGHVDEAGHLNFDGMSKAILNVRGNNVDPAELSAAIGEIDGVTGSRIEGAANGRGDSVPTTEVVAHVTTRPGTDLAPNEVRAHCRRRLAAYKVPARVVIEAEAS